MASFNRVILMGNLTRDPEVRFLPSGMPVADVAIAVNDRYQDKQTQEWVDRPNFIDCTAFGKSAESIGKFFTKGRPIHIEGKLRFEQWDDKTSGQKRSKLKVVIDQWTFCDSRSGGDGGGGGGGGGGGAARGGSQDGGRDDYQSASSGGGGGGHQAINEEDIPF